MGSFRIALILSLLLLATQPLRAELVAVSGSLERVELGELPDEIRDSFPVQLWQPWEVVLKISSHTKMLQEDEECLTSLLMPLALHNGESYTLLDRITWQDAGIDCTWFEEPLPGVVERHQYYESYWLLQLSPSHWTFRYGLLVRRCGEAFNADIFWNRMQVLGEVDVEINGGARPSRDFVSMDLDSMWTDWLPSAAGPDGQPDQQKRQLKIRLKVKDPPGGAVKLWVKLREISWYPGRWTNDYLLGSYPLEPWDGRGTWDCPSKDAWLGPPYYWRDRSGIAVAFGHRKNLDLNLALKSGQGWAIYETQSADLNGRRVYEQYARSGDMTDGSEITLTLDSDDYAATGRLEVMAYDASLTNPGEFQPNVAYHRKLDGRRSLTLPIPRDEEYDYCGQKLTPPVLGDRLGDPWEEEYCHAGSQSGSNIFPGIHELLPFEDSTASNRYWTFLPGTAAKWIKRGDGLVHLEKYRGIFGRDERYYSPHIRLQPAQRNVHLLSVNNRDWVFNSPAADTVYKRDGALDYANRVNASHIMFALLRSKDLFNKNDLNFKNLGVLTEQGRKTLPKWKYPWESGAFMLNGVLTGLPGQDTCVAMVVEEFHDFPQEFWVLMKDCRFVSAYMDNVYTNAMAGSSVSGINVELKHPNLNSEDQYPAINWFTHTYFIPIENYVRGPGYGNRSQVEQETLLRQMQAKVFGHEFGHLVGMDYHASGISIMTQSIDHMDPDGVPDRYLIGDYSTFHLIGRETKP